MSKENGTQPPSAIQAVTKGLEARMDILKTFIGADTQRFIAEVRLALVSDAKLQTCSPESVLRVCQEVAKFRKGIGPWGGWLVPRYNKKTGKTDCTLVWDYRALMDMAREDGAVLDIDAAIVKEGDDFDYQRGTDEFLRHRPPLDGQPGGAFRYAYAIATLRHGIKKFVVLDQDDINRIRARSGAGDSGPWNTDFNAMARKTAIRQLITLLPRSRGKDTMHRAIEAEEGAQQDVVEPVVDSPRLLSGAERAKEFVRQRLEAQAAQADAAPVPPTPEADPEEK